MTPTRSYQFDDFMFQTKPARLFASGEAVAIRPKALQLLELLLTKDGDVATRREISEHLWPDGGERDYQSAINSTLLALRRALQDDAAAPTYVETLPGRGYRFVAAFQNSSVGTDPEQSIETPKWRWSWRKVAFALAALSVVVAAFGWGAGLGGELLTDASSTVPKPTVEVHAMVDSRGPDRLPSSEFLTQELVRVLVLDHSSVLQVAEAHRSDLPDRDAADYLITTNLMPLRDGQMRIVLKVLRASDHLILRVLDYSLAELDLAGWPAVAAQDLTIEHDQALRT